MSSQIVKRVHVIACGVLALDIKAAAERLGIDASFAFLPGGLHERPEELRKRLQEAIDEASQEGVADTIAVGYGVCGLGVAGIHARAIPLVIPRAHDCIAMFLGSDAAYREQFAKAPGTYYVAAGWVEERTQPLSQSGKDSRPATPTDPQYQDLLKRFGKENADAIDYFLRSWQRNYKRAAFIDTGVSEGVSKYADIAEAMARDFGWEYQRIPGTHDLLNKLLTARRSSDEIVCVPPHHVTVYDPLSKGLKAVPVWEREKQSQPSRQRIIVKRGDAGGGGKERHAARFGLGIDAGGTYTDTVVYDFSGETVLQKAKALTTKWNFTIGIDEALAQLDPGHLERIDMIALSTTLATNAIVEGKGQHVGLLLMPPYGRFDPKRFTHSPISLLEGKLEIDGSELQPVNTDQVRQVVRDLLRQGVGAFAVAGYASHANPSHELQVKAIVNEECDLTVTCGHDISEGLNYRVRAETAALNARIIPCLESLLDEVSEALAARSIRAPVVVVKSDGSLMSLRTALEKPIETILSGPAASVAGARKLTRLNDAMVVDIGGTTTDTAMIRDGRVETCEDGARVGGWQTHVRALAMRTLGLGGDSDISIQRRQDIQIGPQRVAPVCWLASRDTRTFRAIEWLSRRLDSFEDSTAGMHILALRDEPASIRMSSEEARVVDVLSEGPASLQELVERTGRMGWRMLPLARLEAHHLVQQCGLTPTDLLHVQGRVDMWDSVSAQRMCELFARLMQVDTHEFAQQALDELVRRLALELFRKELEAETETDGMEDSPVAMAMLERALGKSRGDGYRVQISLPYPLVGIGAPVHCFLPAAAERLHTRAVTPEHADVANAIGAITSSVYIHKQVNITVDENGRYTVGGCPTAPSFADFDAAHDYAVDYLHNAVLSLADQAGTSQKTVEIVVNDKIGQLSDGGALFLERILEGRLTGRPDLARLKAAMG